MGMLRNYIGHKHDDWEDVLELVCFAYRASVHSSTCETPYFLLYGRDPPMLIDRFLNPRTINIITPEDYKSQLMMRMRTAFKLVKDNLEETRKQMKIQYDKRAKVLDYKVGDKVLLDIRVVPIGLNKKLTAKYEGPYRILEIHNDGTVTIKHNSNSTKLVHINRLKPLFETMLWKDEKTIEFTNLDENKASRIFGTHNDGCNQQNNEQKKIQQERSSAASTALRPLADQNNSDYAPRLDDPHYNSTPLRSNPTSTTLPPDDLQNGTTRFDLRD